MKIALITFSNPFFINSASSNRYLSLIEGLKKQGADIHLLIIGGYQSFTELFSLGFNGTVKEIKCSYTVFLLHKRLIYRRISTYILAPLLNGINRRKVFNSLNCLEPEIVWLQPAIEVLELFATKEVYINNKYKIMIELNEYDDTGLVHSTNKLHIKRSLRFSYLLRERTLPAVDVCLVMTKGLLTYYQQYLTKPGVQIALIPMTVDLCRFKGIKDIYEFKKPYIAYCGSSSFSKDGVDVLIKSFSKIALLYTEIKLYIAAFWEIDGNKMIKLISETNMEDRIIYLGTLNRDEIPGFVNNASLLTLPRPPSKQARGGFPTKLGEYLATGNPVCATKVGEIPDYLTDNQSAFLAEPGNIESFSDAMIRALSNSELAKQVGMNGRKVAEKHFSMEIQAERVFSILSENIKYQ